MTLTKKTNHAEEARDNLLSQFWQKTNIRKLLAVYAQQIQDAEDALWDLLVKRWLPNAEGVQLDRIGDIVGFERGERADDDYRRMLEVWILVNRSSGTIPEILEILELLLGDENTIRIVQYFPLAFNVVINDELLANLGDVVLVVAAVRLATVRAIVEYTLTDDDSTFTLSSGDTVETSSTQGYANDAGTTGGEYADAVEA